MTCRPSNDDESAVQALARRMFRAALERLIDGEDRRIVEEELSAVLEKVKLPKASRPAHRPARELWPDLAYWYAIYCVVYPGSSYLSAATAFKAARGDLRSEDTIRTAMQRAVKKAENNAE